MQSMALSSALRNTFFRIAAAAYFAGLLAAFTLPGFIRATALIPPDSLHPIRWYTFLTFSITHSSFRHWLTSVALMLPAVLVLQGAHRWPRLFAFALGAGVIGGIVYVTFAAGGNPLIGAGLATWGLAGAAVATLVRRRVLFGILARIYGAVVVVVVLVTVIIGGTPESWAVVAAAVSGAVMGFVTPLTIIGPAAPTRLVRPAPRVSS